MLSDSTRCSGVGDIRIGLNGGHGSAGTAEGSGGMTSSLMILERIFSDDLNEGERDIEAEGCAGAIGELVEPLGRFEGEDALDSFSERHRDSSNSSSDSAAGSGGSGGLLGGPKEPAFGTKPIIFEIEAFFSFFGREGLEGSLLFASGESLTWVSRSASSGVRTTIAP